MDELTQDEIHDLDALRDALRAAKDVPRDVLAHAKAVFTWRSVDAELAALTFDSAQEALYAGVRGESVTLRSLSFEGPTVLVELEVRPDGVLGQVVPPQGGIVEVDAPSGPITVLDLDDLGAFTLRPPPEGRFRLAFRLADGLRVVTSWFQL